MKVLIAAPTSERKDYCFDRWADQVRNLTYPYYDIYMVDNSENKEYHYKILEKGIKCDHIDRDNKPMPQLLVDSQNLIRDYFLAHDYTHLFMLETDVSVPPNIIEYMLLYNYPVHNITYFMKEAEDTCIGLQSRTERRTKILSPELSFRTFTGEVKQMSSYIYDNETYLYASGIGCTMIQRFVMEKIKFRCDKIQDKKLKQHTFSDSFFHIDCENHKIANYFDSSIIVEHDRSSWNNRKINLA